MVITLITEKKRSLNLEKILPKLLHQTVIYSPNNFQRKQTTVSKTMNLTVYVENALINVNPSGCLDSRSRERRSSKEAEPASSPSNLRKIHRVEFAYRNNPWWMGHGMKESTREQGTGFYRLLITSRRFPRTALAPLLQTSPLTLENLGGRELAIRTTYFHVKISFQNFPRSYFTYNLENLSMWKLFSGGRFRWLRRTITHGGR